MCTKATVVEGIKPCCYHFLVATGFLSLVTPCLSVHFRGFENPFITLTLTFQASSHNPTISDHLTIYTYYFSSLLLLAMPSLRGLLFTSLLYFTFLVTILLKNPTKLLLSQQQIHSFVWFDRLGESSPEDCLLVTMTDVLTTVRFETAKNIGSTDRRHKYRKATINNLRDSDDDVGQCHQQQSFWGLLSPGRSNHLPANTL